MKLKPTTYQKRALESIDEIKVYQNSAIVQMASGLGKTYFAGFESLNYKGKILFICHRKEILTQAKEVFKKIYEKSPHQAKTMGFFHGYKKEPNKNILFASIQLIHREKYLESFKEGEFDLIIIDEFHHALANSYRKLMEHFKPKFWLGITATPYRHNDPNGEKLQKLFNSKIIYNYDLVDGIDNGHLSPFILIFQKDNIDYSKIEFNAFGFYLFKFFKWFFIFMSYI